jgi:hypothetical protein
MKRPLRSYPMDPDLLRELKRTAKREHVSISSLVRWAVRMMLDAKREGLTTRNAPTLVLGALRIRRAHKR